MVELVPSMKSQIPPKIKQASTSSNKIPTSINKLKKSTNSFPNPLLSKIQKTKNETSNPQNKQEDQINREKRGRDDVAPSRMPPPFPSTPHHLVNIKFQCTINKWLKERQAPYTLQLSPLPQRTKLNFERKCN